MSSVGVIQWTAPPFSALCLLSWGGGTASGWLLSQTRLVTAGHVVDDIDSSPLTISSAFGPIMPGAFHDTIYRQTAARPPQGGRDDFAVIEVSNVPAQCTFLKMAIPSRLWSGPVFLLAFNTNAEVQFTTGTVAQYSDVRFLHSCDAWPGYSGGAVIVQSPPVGAVAIGIHTDVGRSYAELKDDPGGGLAPRGSQYKVATSLSVPVQQLLAGAQA